MDRHPVAEDVWFVFGETRHFGPLSTEQVRDLLSEGRIGLNSYAWQPGMGDWQEISSVEALGLFQEPAKNWASEALLAQALENFASDSSGTGFSISISLTHLFEAFRASFRPVFQKLSPYFGTFKRSNK